MTEETSADLAQLWGPPQESVALVLAGELIAALWQDEQAVGILPFERLESRLKPLWLDDLSAVDNRLEQGDWPLALRVWLHGAGAEADDLLAHLRASVLATNRDPDKLTVLVMTGVTAMSRTTA